MTGKTFLGIGECMVELSQAPGGLLRQGFAGDVLNTLWYAQDALPEGWGTSFLSAVGTDPVSAQMVEFIESGSINCAPVQRLEGKRPGLYMIHLDNGERSFSYWRDTSAARQLAAEKVHLANSIDIADLIYLSGITLAILPDEDVATMLALLTEAKAGGTVVAFDPNIRPALWPDTDRLHRLVAQTAAASSLVFPSFDDETAAFGDADPAASLARYAGYGCPVVVLKNGAAEMLIQNGDAVETVPTRAVTTPVDTTGAGDSFNGAFLANYVTTGDPVAAALAGQSCAARVIQHPGALIPR